MPNNTDASDVNEIGVAYYLAGEKWFDQAAKQQFERKSKSLGVAETAIQMARAKAMAQCIEVWAKDHGYKGGIKNIWWTARPGGLSSTLGFKIDSKKNPSDILVQYRTGPADGYIGFSLKSTKSSGDIGFKNPGIGTIGAVLNLELVNLYGDTVQESIRKFKLPENSKQRKAYIRERPEIADQTRKIGFDLLEKITDIIHAKLMKMSDAELRNYILENWLNASNDLYPPYVKVTGLGDKPEKIRAKIEDPLKNEKLSAVLSEKIDIQKAGTTTLTVKAGQKKIMKMRIKWESEKLASAIKFSGDPW